MKRVLKVLAVLTLGTTSATAQTAAPQTPATPRSATPRSAVQRPPTQRPAGPDNHQHAPGDDHAGHDHGPNAAGANAEHGGAPRDESNTAYFWRKSDQAFHNGDYDRAVSLHRAIVALDPHDIESYSVAAWLLWSMEKPEDATAFLQRGLAANPESWEMWDSAGQHYDLRKMKTEAKAAYVRAVSLIPKGEDAQMLRRRLAHAAEREGDIALSLQTWRDLVRDFPNEPVNHNNLARVEKLPRKD